MGLTIEKILADKRLKIAEACGFIDICVVDEDCYDHMDSFLGGRKKEHPFGKRQQVPDYFEDLNGMHEAEKVIFDTYDRSAWFRYLTHLENESMCGGNATHMDHVHATAAQRAEAFGKTLNLW